MVPFMSDTGFGEHKTEADVQKKPSRVFCLFVLPWFRV